MLPTPAPAERFATILQWLIKAVAARSDWRRPDQLPGPLVTLICIRISRISQLITRLAASIAAGTYRPRRFAPRCPSTRRHPRQSRFPHRAGWLLRLAPGGLGVGGYRCWLETLLQEPDMVALMQAAPEAMGRPIRSLCWMLLITPPPVLAPQRPASPQPAPAAAATPPASVPPETPPPAEPAPCRPVGPTPTSSARSPPLPA